MTLYKRLLRYVQPHWRLIVIMLVASAVYSSTNAIYVTQLESIVDAGFVDKDLSVIYQTIGIILAVTLCRGIGFFVGNYTSSRVSNDIVLALRKQMFAKLQRLPTVYFDRENSGHTLSLFNYHVSQVTDAATKAAITLAREGVLVLVALVYLFYQNWQLTLLIFALTPIMAVVIRLISKSSKSTTVALTNKAGLPARYSKFAMLPSKVWWQPPAVHRLLSY